MLASPLCSNQGIYYSPLPAAGTPGQLALWAESVQVVSWGQANKHTNIQRERILGWFKIKPRIKKAHHSLHFQGLWWLAKQ